MTESGIRYQPLLVLLEELLKGSRLHRLGTFLSIDGTQILHLGIVYTLIVDLWQGVQRFTQNLVLLAQFFVFQLWQLAQIGVLRMQCIDADRVVGI